jgi:ferredoxin
MKVHVDEERCRGHGMCTTLCSDVFIINDDGYAEVVVDEVPAEHEAAAREAIECCPEQAISSDEPFARRADNEGV